MEVQITYFYNIRHFTPNMIPLSTAMWDPKWYHNFGNQDVIFVDKRNVLNGLRIKPLVPGSTCHDLCRGLANCKVGNPKSCDFLKRYKEQLDALDFLEIYDKMKKLCNRVQTVTRYQGNPIAIILVHEKPDNPCSERWPIIQWFEEHGVSISEFQRNSKSG